MSGEVCQTPQKGVNLAFTNDEVEISPEKILKRSQTTLTEVDLEILDKQRQEDDGSSDLQSEIGGLPTVSFFGRTLQANPETLKRWGPFRKKSSGVLGVLHTQSKRNRLVSKHGRINTFRRKEEIKGFHRYLKDFFTSFIDISWSWTFFLFTASFFLSWFIFSILWYLVAYVHGDLELERPDNHTVCVDNIKDFTSCFLFSIETQHTIGYGGRATTEQCSVAIIVMAMQSIVGVIIQACMAGIVFAKFTKPICRGETIMFSRNALISMRNGALYLLVRLGDLRPTHLIECHLSAHFLTKEITEEGEVIPYHLVNMEFGSSLDGDSDYIQPFWPIVVSHKIDSSSPLYQMAPKDFQTRQFEIILTLEGTTPETGNTVQVRTSYLPSEILWGQRFEHSTVAYDKEVAKYAVCYKTLNNFVQDNTPRCSAKDLEDKFTEKETK